MQTKDLPVGAHVAYNNGSRNYPTWCEAYVFAHRPRGYRYSGSHSTIGIAYSRPYNRTQDDKDIWGFKWVRPADITETWADHVEFEQRCKVSAEYQAKARAEAQADRREQLARIPTVVIDALGLRDYEINNIVERGYYDFRLNLDKIEAVIRAVRRIDAGQDDVEIEDTLNRFGISL